MNGKREISTLKRSSRDGTLQVKSEIIQIKIGKLSNSKMKRRKKGRRKRKKRGKETR